MWVEGTGRQLGPGSVPMVCGVGVKLYCHSGVGGPRGRHRALAPGGQEGREHHKQARGPQSIGTHRRDLTYNTSARSENQAPHVGVGRNPWLSSEGLGNTPSRTPLDQSLGWRGASPAPPKPGENVKGSSWFSKLPPKC